MIQTIAQKNRIQGEWICQHQSHDVSSFGVFQSLAPDKIKRRNYFMSTVASVHKPVHEKNVFEFQRHGFRHICGGRVKTHHESASWSICVDDMTAAASSHSQIWRRFIGKQIWPFVFSGLFWPKCFPCVSLLIWAWYFVERTLCDVTGLDNRPKRKRKRKKSLVKAACSYYVT